MANYQVAYHLTFRDIDGAVAVTTGHNGHVADATTMAQLATHLASFAAAVQGASNGLVVQTSVSFLVTEITGVGADAQFPLTSQKAVLRYANAAGARAQVAIPAPKEIIFRSPPSDDIVDSGQALVTAITASVAADLGDLAGGTLNVFAGGALTSHHRSRRRNIRT